VPPGEHDVVLVLEEQGVGQHTPGAMPPVPSPEPAAAPASADLVKQRLLAAGLLSEIKPPPAATPGRVPIEVQGQPLSELIIEERR
jgi:hypothetical protein